MKWTVCATLSADEGYDVREFVEEIRELEGAPRVAQSDASSSGSVIDRRTTRHGGYEVSQNARKRIEEVFGWAQSVEPMHKSKFRGTTGVDFQMLVTMSGYNLIRMRNLLADP